MTPSTATTRPPPRSTVPRRARVDRGCRRVPRTRLPRAVRASAPAPPRNARNRSRTRSWGRSRSTAKRQKRKRERASTRVTCATDAGHCGECSGAVWSPFRARAVAHKRLVRASVKGDIIGRVHDHTESLEKQRNRLRTRAPCTADACVVKRVEMAALPPLPPLTAPPAAAIPTTPGQAGTQPALAAAVAGDAHATPPNEPQQNAQPKGKQSDFGR
jgi:hypothetical protein